MENIFNSSKNEVDNDKYNISKNKGYGAKKHMDGIKEHGISRWHRKSFKPCKT